ncbi:response regulator [Fusibacter sp. JL216-2]|uniref:response regulator n=1 Tax=Fusibacter sp. JL216-2 TaxID=3071453 RepID=UPI003D341977
MKVLIVDDSLFMRHFIKTALLQLEIEEIIEAEDGYKAVELYQKHRPDLVLLDINMPHMNGIEALRAIRQIDTQAKIIMLSSMRNQRTVKESKSLGASAYMQKPFPKMQLEEIVNEVYEETLPN